MNEHRDLLERVGERFAFPDQAFERLARRRDRKHRNQRVAAGLVGFAVFAAAIWIVTTGGPFDRALTPGTSGPAPAPPSVTDPAPDDPTRPGAVGFIGLPPDGATPSTPEDGELVLSLYGRSSTDGGLFRAWVYADGRIVWAREGDFPYGANEATTGLLEQHLTPEGVERMRSEMVSTGLFEHDLALLSGHVRENAAGFRQPVGFMWGSIRVREDDRLISVDWSNPEMYPQDTGTPATPEQASALERLDGLLTHPESWLPASAWQDQGIKAYVPSRYAVCYDPAQRGVGPSRILSALPKPVALLLRASAISGPRGATNCSDVTTEQAVYLARFFEREGLEQDDRSSYGRLGYIFEPPVPHASGTTDDTVAIYFEPILPNGEWMCSVCG